MSDRDGNEAQAVSLIVGLTRVYELPMPFSGRRNRHRVAKHSVAHLSPTIPLRLPWIGHHLPTGHLYHVEDSAAVRLIQYSARYALRPPLRP